MILQTTSASVVPLDALNNLYQPLARYDARLLDLHGDWATLTLPPDASVSCLHWGSLVRFTFRDDQHRCEAEGIVVAHRQVGEAANEEDTGMGQEESVSPASLRAPRREITVHLWQCQQKEERRLGPRRWPRIAVLLRPEREISPGRIVPAGLAEDAAEECWESGWAVDLSANGMRLRTPVCLPLKQRVRLQFALPISPDNNDGFHSSMNSNDSHNVLASSEDAPERLAPPRAVQELPCSRRRFLVTGRVLRSERTRTAASHQAMICFEQLTADEGLALSRFLAG